MDNVTVAKTACSHLDKKMSERVLSDYQPFFDSLADDVVLTHTSPDGSGEVRGKQAVIESITDTFSTSSSPEVIEDIQLERPLEFIGDDRVVVLWAECTRNKNTGLTSNGKEVAVVMDFRDGLITRMLKFSQ